MTYEEIVKEQIGKFIQDAMKERKINMSELERRSGVSRTIIYKIVKGGQYQIDGLIKVMRHLEYTTLKHEEQLIMLLQSTTCTVLGQ